MVAFGNAIFAHFVRKRYSFAAICTHFREYAICAYGARVMPTTIKDSHRILTIVITAERGNTLMSKNANPAGRVVTLSNGKPSGIHIASRRDISRPKGISRTEGASRKLKVTVQAKTVSSNKSRELPKTFSHRESSFNTIEVNNPDFSAL